MGQNIATASESQAKRLKIKTLDQQLKRLVVEGTGLGEWEALILIEKINEVYFSDPDLAELQDNQLKYSCVSSSEGAGKPLDKCLMVSVVLTLFSPEDEEGLLVTDKQGSINKKQRQIMRITSEARSQGGLLSQEDLGKILMCDTRTIRRYIKDLNNHGIIVPTRGQQKDIGPGVTHKGVAIRSWLEGMEPVSICFKIKHSIKAVENYLEKFKRVAYLREKNFDDFQIAMTIGISVHATKEFVEIYKEFKNKAFTKNRIAEIELVGSQFYAAQDEKKDSRMLRESNKKGILQ